MFELQKNVVDMSYLYQVVSLLARENCLRVKMYFYTNVTLIEELVKFPFFVCDTVDGFLRA